MKLKELIIKLQSIESRFGGELDCFVNDANGKWANCDKYGAYTFNERTVFIGPAVFEEKSKRQLPLLDESNVLLF